MAPGLAVLLSKWISIQVRSNLEDILVIARSHAHSFGLSEANNSETNKHNFRAATYLSAYLHKLHFPQFSKDPLVSLLSKKIAYYWCIRPHSKSAMRMWTQFSFKLFARHFIHQQHLLSVAPIFFTRSIRHWHGTRDWLGSTGEVHFPSISMCWEQLQ